MQIKRKMKIQKHNERSAGGVVFRGGGRSWHWLVIKTRNKKSKRRRPVFKLPKGHLDKAEFLKEAALREVEEEGQVKAEILSKIGSNNYIYTDRENGKKVIKKVTFFLMKYLSPSSLRYRDAEEIMAKVWLDTEEAIKRLDYKSEKIILKRARQRLDSLVRRGKIKV